MKESVKEPEATYRKDKISLCLAVLAITLFGMLFWFDRGSKVQNLCFNGETVSGMSGEFLVQNGTEEFHTTLPASVDGHAGQLITISGILEENSFYNSVMFYVQQSQVRAYLDGTLMIESDPNPFLPMKMPPVSRWYFFRLPEDCAGKELRIEILPTFDEYARELPEIWLGTKAAFLYMIVSNAVIPLLIGLPMVLMGLVLLVIGLFLKDRGLSQKLERLGLLAMVISIWILLESQIAQLFTGNLYLVICVLFSCYYLIPVVLMAFLLTFPSIKEKKYMQWMFPATAAVYVLIQFLQITGIGYYIRLVWVVHVEVILITAGIVLCYVSLRKKENQEEDRSIYKALFILGTLAMGDIVYYYRNPSGNAGRFSLIGILVFQIYLGYSAIRRSVQIQERRVKEDVYRELAFKDLMTGLENRSAFEKEQKRLQQTETPGSLLFLMADVNNLKMINDNYGHKMGDDAIVSTAALLKECFDRECRCFRVGGDEFCVITENLEEKEFEEMHRRFEQRLEAVSGEKEYPFFVASGYYAADSRDIEECMKQADKKMYQRKFEMKREES